jgi:hypothetical protein
VVNYELADELLLARSDAVIFVLRHLRAAGHGPAGRDLRADAIASSSSSSHLAFWRVAGIVLRVIPRPLRDWGYGVVARHRYRWFGRFEKCPLPTEETRVRFMDV